MGPNFNVSVPPTFITEASNILESLNIKLVAVVVGKSVFVSCVFIIFVNPFLPRGSPLTSKIV